MNGSGCCGGGLRAILLAKLGRCMLCMRVAALGTLVAWAALAVAFGFGRPAVPIVAAIAVSFTLLLGAHVIAYTRRATRLSNTLVPLSPPASNEGTTVARIDRRAFFTRALGAATAVTTASILGPRILEGHWSAIAFAAEGECRMVEAEADDVAGFFTVKCDGECPPLVQVGPGGAERHVSGECRLVAQLVTNTDGQAFARYRCVCVYPEVESNCKAVKKGKMKYACEGDCPTLFRVDARGNRKKVAGQCIPIVEQEGGGIRISCICIYG